MKYIVRSKHELIQLDPQAKFFEVDTEKDQIMAHVRIGLHNSALWARDYYFSSTYRHATPLTLWRTFFNPDGFCRETDDSILVTLKPFRTPRTQREAIQACQRFNARQVKTLSGKTIKVHVVEFI